MAKSPEEELIEAQERGLRAHRESVIWYLRQKLEASAEAQREMMETRIAREIEKSKSVLYKSRDAALAPHIDRIVGSPVGEGGPGSAKSTWRTEGQVALSEEKQSGTTDLGLSPEQIQLFEKENNDMMKHYEDTLDQVRYVRPSRKPGPRMLTTARTAERSMIEISELQSTLAQNLEMQSTRIDQLVEDTANTEVNVAGGNKQLKRASERFRPARYVYLACSVIRVFVILWNLI